MNWGERYAKGDTPWEKGEPHPELPFLLEEHRDLLETAQSILVPGCGTGHGARLIGSVHDCSVTGLDLAEEAIEKARAQDASDGLVWEVGDLFEWEGSYDLVFEHTCFCAIPLERRRDYVKAMGRLLPAGGHLLGVFFLNPDHAREEGPPFGVTISELHDYFDETFELIWSEPPSQTYLGREGEGRERCLLMRRRS